LGVEVLIPAIVIAETVRGNQRDAPVNRVIGAVDSVASIDEPVGRVAGALLGATGLDQAIDAVVIAVAAAGGGRVLTSDPHDLSRLASHVAGVSIHEV
jgi:predicted nucleic acid-binding protein